MTLHTILKINDLAKHYRDVAACRVGELTVEAPLTYAIVGPSGAGKTTFLRLVNGLTPPDRGRMQWSGPHLTAQNRGVMVFQEPYLFRGTVGYNIGYGLQLQGHSPQDVARRAGEAAALVGLEGALAWKVDTLSAGEAQRVALARALAVKPPLLLLDEPTANLDPVNVRMIEQVLKDIQSQWQVTILLVTHNLAQARRMGDKVIFFYRGQMELVSSGDNFFDAPYRSRGQQLYLEGEMISD